MVRIVPLDARQGIDPGSAPSTARDNSVGQAIGQLGDSLGRLASVEQDHQLRLLQQKQKMEEFGIEQQWQRTQGDIAAAYDQAKLGIDPSGAGFTEKTNKLFIDQYDAFLKTVPDALKPRFSELVLSDKNTRELQAAADEVAQRNTWYEVGVTDTVNAAQTAVAANPGMFDQRLADVTRTIDATDLPATKKADLKRSASQMLGRSWFETQMRNDPAFAKTLLGVGVGGDGDAAGLIRGFEGFQRTAYADTVASTGEFSAYRVGYGSDTVTRADGTVEKVTAQTVVTPADAERDLARRVKEFQATAIGQVGADRWAALPASARAGLTSVAYNYGSLPDSVVNAAKSGKTASIAAAVERLSANPERRAKEAAVIRGGGEPAPEVASLPFNERVKLFDQSSAAESQLAVQQSAQAKADYEKTKGQLELSIELGEVASKQSILDAPLDDGDKAILLSKWQTQQGKNAEASTFLTAFTSGTAPSVNPYNTDQRKVANDAYDLLMKSTPADKRAESSMNFVRGTGFVPDPVVADIRQKLNSTDVAQVAEGLGLARQIMDMSPSVLDAIENGKELRDAAIKYDVDRNQKGLSAEDSALSLIKIKDPAQQQKRDVLDAGWKAAVKDGKVTASDFINDPAFDQNGILLGGAPSGGLTYEQSAALEKDWADLVQQKYFDWSGDLETAKAQAKIEMKRIWNVSSVSGQPVLMRYPPEAYYPQVDKSQSYIRDLALKDARGIDPTASNIMLQPITQTAQEIKAGKPPTYALFYQSAGNGAWNLAGGFNIGLDKITALQGIADTRDAMRSSILQEFERAKRDPAILAKFPAVGGRSGGFRPGFTMENVVPDFALKQSKIVDLGQQQNNLLGKPATATAAPGVDPQLQEQLFLQQQSEAFGMGGGGVMKPFGASN